MELACEAPGPILVKRLATTFLQGAVVHVDRRQQAQSFVTYYSYCDQQFAADWWLAGLRAANKWLQFVESPSVAQDEVASLLDTAKANQRSGTMWAMMAVLIYRWAEETGYKVPSPKEFFH